MWTAGFPEPLTFSLRAARLLRARSHEFDVVHDNQCLGYGLPALQKAGIPLVAPIHHPLTHDRRAAPPAARTGFKRFGVRGWYGSVRRPARRGRRTPDPPPVPATP